MPQNFPALCDCRHPSRPRRGHRVGQRLRVRRHLPALFTKIIFGHLRRRALAEVRGRERAERAPRWLWGGIDRYMLNGQAVDNPNGSSRGDTHNYPSPTPPAPTPTPPLTLTPPPPPPIHACMRTTSLPLTPLTPLCTPSLTPPLPRLPLSPLNQGE